MSVWSVLNRMSITKKGFICNSYIQIRLLMHFINLSLQLLHSNRLPKIPIASGGRSIQYSAFCIIKTEVSSAQNT